MGSQWLHLKTTRFQVQLGEDEEIINDGMYGQAVARHLQQELPPRGIAVDFECAEDWGWWVQVGGQPFTLGVCLYSGDADPEIREWAVTLSRGGGRAWSWKRCRFIETGPRVKAVWEAVESVFTEDPEVEIVGITEECPW